MPSASVFEISSSVSVVDGEQKRDETLDDVSVAHALHFELVGPARFAGVADAPGRKPNLAGAAADLIGVRTERLWKRRSARPSSMT